MRTSVYDPRLRGGKVQLKGLKLADRMYSIWIDYFLSESAPAPEESSLRDHVKGFNIRCSQTTVPRASVRIIEVNPRQELSAILNLSEPLSPSYFMFCKNLLYIENKQTQQDIIDQYAPDLMRAFIAFEYQFSVQCVQCQDPEADRFEIGALDDVAWLIDVLLRSPIVSDFIYVFHGMLDNFLQTEKLDKNLRESFPPVLHVLLRFLEINDQESEDMKVLVEFLVEYFNRMRGFSSEFISLCGAIAARSWLVNMLSDDVFSTFVTNMGGMLCEISTESATEERFGCGLVVLKALSVCLSLKAISFSVAEYIIALVKWCHQLEHHHDVDIRGPPNVIPHSRQSEMEWRWVDGRIRVKAVVKKYDQTETGIFNREFPHLSQMIPYIAEIVPKHHEIIKFAITECSANGKLILAYFVMKLFNRCGQKLAIKIMKYFNAWTYFLSSVVLNSETVCEEGDALIVDYLKLILNLCGRNPVSDNGCFLNVLASFLDGDSPKVVSFLFNYVESTYCQEIQNNLMNSIFIDCGIRVSNDYRALPTITEEQIEARSIIWYLVCHLCQSEEGFGFIITDETRSAYVFSMLFEAGACDLAIELVAHGMKHNQSLMPCKQLSSMLTMALKCTSLDDRGLNLLWMLLDRVFLAVKLNEDVMMRNVLATNLLSVISRLPDAIMQTRDTKTVLQSINKVISFFSSISRASSKFEEAICSACSPVAALEKTLETADTDDSVVDALIAFVGDNKRMRYYKGIEMLFSLAVKDAHRDRIIQYFLEMTKMSIANRYQCMKTGILAKLLLLLEKHQTQEVLELISQIGSSFFTMSDVSLTFRMIYQTDQPFSLPLLSCLMQMIDAKKGPPSFFHFVEGDEMKFPSFVISSCFTVSMNIAFSPELEQYNFFLIRGENNKLQFAINGQDVLIQLECGLKHYAVTFPGVIKRGVRQHLEFGVARKIVSLAVDGGKPCSETMSPEINFGKKPVNISMSHVYCDVDDIKIMGKRGNVFANFSAKCVTGKVCKNIGSSTIGDATFTGLAVPFTTSIVQSLPIFGGAVVFLPLFEHISASECPEQFLKTLLTLFNRLALEDVGLFQNQVFFQSFAHLLARNGANLMTSDCVDLLFQMYKQATNQEFRRNLLKYVFSDVSMWNNMSDSITAYMFSAVYVILLDVDPKFFLETTPLESYLTQFIVESENPKKPLFRNAWNFLTVLSLHGVNEVGAQLLPAAVMRTSNEIACLESMITLVDVILGKQEIARASLKSIGALKPFCCATRLNVEETRILAFKAMYCVIRTLDIQEASAPLLECVRIMNNNGTTSHSTETLLYLMTKQMSSRDFPGKDVVFDYENVAPILMPEFLPLMCATIPYVDASEAGRVCEYLRTSYTQCEEALTVCQTCNYWVLWLLFLSQFDSNQDEWLDIIARSITFSNNYIDDLILFVTACRNVGLSPQHRILATLIQAFNRFPTCDTVEYVILQLFYDVDVGAPNISRDDFIQTFVHSFVVPRTLKAKITFNPEFSGKKLQLAIDVARFMISQGVGYLTRPSTIIPGRTEPVLCVLAYVICQIAVRSRNDGLMLAKSLVSQLSKAKFELCSGMFLLLEFWHDETISGFLTKKLKERDAGVDISNVPVLNAILTRTKTEVEEYYKAAEKMLEDKYEVEILKVRTKAQLDLRTVFDMHNDDEWLGTDALRATSRLRLALENTANNNSRTKRVYAKAWRSTFKAMSKQFGGPWSKFDNHELHFRFDTVIDNIGRRNKMKINTHFNDHKDASRRRDTGQSDEANSVHLMPVPHQEKVETPSSFELELVCRLLTTTLFFKGTLYLCHDSLVFEAKETTDPFGNVIEQTSKLIAVSIDLISFVMKRRYLHIDCACEVFTVLNKSYFLILDNYEARKTFFVGLKGLKPKQLKFIQMKDAMEIYNSMNIAKNWKSGKMSNFEYLFWVNCLSGRSIHDLTQYPVYPWILSNYRDEHLDLNDETNFRDLSKPIGMLNEERLQMLKELYKDLGQDEMKCLYRFHYSTPAYVISYLMRREPFVSLHIQLQNGQFDIANRLFYSIENAWESVCASFNDFRELIPEFFCTPEFLLNVDRYDLGYRNKSDESREPVDHVQLPPWAHNTSAFIALNRIALESPYVSANLHKWIDQIFGVNQRSEKANVLFHPFSYSSAIDEFPDRLPQVQLHAANFGITPQCIFSQPHAPRGFSPLRLNLMEGKEVFFTYTDVHNFQKPVWRFQVVAAGLMVLFTDGTIATYQIGKNGNLSLQKSTQLDIPLTLIRSCVECSGPMNCVVIAPPWMQEVLCYSLSRKKMSNLSAHASVVTAFAVDGRFCVTAAADSSIAVWDLDSLSLVTMVIAHTASVRAIAVCEENGVIASIDAHGGLVFSSLLTGAFLQRMELEEVPRLVFLASLGFCVLIYDEREDQVITGASITLTDLAGRVLATRKLDGRCTAAKVIENLDATGFLVLAQETNVVYIMSIWDLTVVSAGPISGNACDMSYNPAIATLYICTENGTLHKACFAK